MERPHDFGKLHDAIVVGGGPAGVTCAVWLKQLGFNVAVVERRDRCGGLQTINPYSNTWIPTSPHASGTQVADSLHASMLEHRVPMLLSTEVTSVLTDASEMTVSLHDGRHLPTRNLVIATGVAPKAGGFVARVGMIVGPGRVVAETNFSNANVAILGGGDNAFENYHFVRAGGARSVTIFARNVRARLEAVETVPPEAVTLGDYLVDSEQNTVNGQQYDQILVLYGYEVAESGLLGLQLTRRADGFLWTNADCMTNIDGVFAIGEVAQKSHPCCVTSMADGVNASKAIQRRLESSGREKLMGMFRRTATLGMVLTKTF